MDIPGVQQWQQQHQFPQDFNFTRESRMGESVGRERDTITLFIAPVLITIIALGFIGNTSILYAVCAVRRFNRAENLMLANLAITSVGIMISTLSAYIQMGYTYDFYGPFYCNLYPGIHTFTQPAEGFTMMCISLERTQRVRFPMRRVTKESAIKKIALVWFLALLLDMPRGFLFYTYDPDIASLLKCRNTKEIFGSWIIYAIYATINYSLTYLLPSFWLARDWAGLFSKAHFLVACETLTLQSEYRRRQKKLIGHAVIFTSIFIAVKVPVGMYLFMYQLPPQLQSETVIGWVKPWKTLFFSIGLVQCCFYPFIIFALSRDIRTYLFCCDGDRRQHPVSRY